MEEFVVGVSSKDTLLGVTVKELERYMPAVKDAVVQICVNFQRCCPFFLAFLVQFWP